MVGETKAAVVGFISGETDGVELHRREVADARRNEDGGRGL